MDERDIVNDTPDLELDLEDILKEFGEGSESQPEPLMELAAAEMPIAQEPPLEQRLKLYLSQTDEDEDVKEFVPQSQASGSAMTDETVRMDLDAVRAAMGDKNAVTTDATVRFEPLGDVEAAVSMDATIRFQPLGDTEPEEESAPEPAAENAEPFSASWEPQYDAPMGEYVAPEPLQFRPRSRLHELKRKLIAGPERRYYAIAELGFGKLQAAIFLSLLVVVLSCAAIVMHSSGMVRPERMKLLVFGELFAMMFSAILASTRMLDGLSAIFKKRFTPDTMLLFSFLVCMADGFFCLKEVRVPFCAAFCLMTTFSLWAEYQRRNTEMGQMDTLRKAVRLNRVAKAPNCYEGRPGFYTGEGQVEDFMDSYRMTTTPEKMMSWYCLLAFLASGGIAAAAGYFGGVSAGLQAWSAAILAALPVSSFICQTRPMAILERRLHKLGVVLCGWTGVKEMSGAAAIPLKDTDLFPAGSMKINGVKFYTRRDPDQVVAYATSVMECTGNALTPLFTRLLDSRNGIHYETTLYRSYENGGVGGEVCEESVLLGSAQFLTEMGVEIPEGTRVNQAVYCAVDGELCAVFALAFGKLKGVNAGLSSLCGYRGLTPVLVSDNFLLTEGFLRSKFSVNTRRVAFPLGEQRQTVENWFPDEAASIPCALTTQEGLAPTAFAITGARTLRTASNWGTVLHMLAGICGLAMVLVLTLVSGGYLLTPSNLLLFHLIWTIPGLLVSSWTRHI